MSGWGAVGAIGGSLISGLLGLQASKHAGDGILSLDEQKQLFDYQQNRLEKLQNSAHQREVTDLRNAGLNPILSAGGSGAQSGLGASIDTAGYNSARSQANQAKIQARLSVAQGLADVGSRLLDYSVNSQNADSNSKQADAALMNAETNALSSASTIALNAKTGSKLEADAKVALDQLLTNKFTRENLRSSTTRNFASADEIRYLMEPRKDLMEAQQYGSLSSAGATILGTAAKSFRGALTSGAKGAKGIKNSAKDVKNSGEKLKDVIDKLPKKHGKTRINYKPWKHSPEPPSIYDINKVYGGF